MRVTPLDDNILIEIVRSDRTESGLYVPEQVVKERMTRFYVRAVGPGKMLITGERAPMQVKEGDEVFLPIPDGQEVNILGFKDKGVEYGVIPESVAKLIVHEYWESEVVISIKVKGKAQPAQARD